MKLLVLSLLTSAAAMSASSNSEFEAELRGHPDGNGAFQTLSHLMTAAQQKLSLVERRYGKVVKKARKEADSFLAEEANVYADGLGSYSSEILQAEADLQSAVVVAQTGLKEAEEASAKSKTNSWNDPQVMQRAELNSQVDSTARVVKRTDRQRESELREAREQSEESLETAGQKLGLKLGDMTPIVDKAKKSIEARIEKTPAAAAAPKVNAPAPKSVNLKSLQADLSKAVSKEQAAVGDAKKKLDGFLSKTDKDVAIKHANIENSLKAKQQDEITQVLGAAPAKTTKVKVAAAKAQKPNNAKTVSKAKAEAPATATKVVVAAAKAQKPNDAKTVSKAKADKWVTALDKDLKTKMLVQVQPRTSLLSGIKDPCASITCAANLKCPAGFSKTQLEGHCCPYCVNPNIKLEAAITGATGSNGGKASTFCPKVWCFPTMCTKAISNPTTTNGSCCASCPAF